MSMAKPVICLLYTSVALFGFGAIKGHFTGVQPLRGGMQTVMVGGLAAAAAYWLARRIS